MKTISLVVPFFNEEDIIEDRVKKIQNYLSKNFDKFELILVDDGSTDSSNSKVKSVIKNFDKIKLLESKTNKGRGNAVRKGFNLAKLDIIGYLDCDLELTLDNIPHAIKSLEEYDIVVASKFIKQSKVEAPFFRKTSSYFYNLLVNLILQTGISDHQAGFKFFRKKIIKKLIPNTREDGWLWDIEVLYTAKKMNYNVAELPVKVRYGYRRFRPTFISDFLKLPVFILLLKRKVDKRLYEKK